MLNSFVSIFVNSYCSVLSDLSIFILVLILILKNLCEVSLAITSYSTSLISLILKTIVGLYRKIKDPTKGYNNPSLVLKLHLTHPAP